MYIYSYIHICEYEYIYVNMNIYIYMTIHVPLEGQRPMNNGYFWRAEPRTGRLGDLSRRVALYYISFVSFGFGIL